VTTRDLKIMTNWLPGLSTILAALKLTDLLHISWWTVAAPFAVAVVVMVGAIYGPYLLIKWKKMVHEKRNFQPRKSDVDELMENCAWLEEHKLGFLVGPLAFLFFLWLLLGGESQ
jgi:hypothetical protein